MVVKTYRDGRDQLGLLVGRTNARRYFRKHAQTIDLVLDGLEIQCRLSPDFWTGRSEIRDPRLSEWLEFKVGRGRAGAAPLQVTMVPSGVDAFLIRPRADKTYEGFGAEVSLAKPVRSESLLTFRRVPVLASRSVA